MAKPTHAMISSIIKRYPSPTIGAASAGYFFVALLQPLETRRSSPGWIAVHSMGKQSFITTGIYLTLFCVLSIVHMAKMKTPKI
jgi:hypothetical protein